LEVDFALVRENIIESIIEAKLSESTPTKALKKFHERYGYPAIQLVKALRNEHKQEDINILKAEKFLSDLFL